MHSRSSKYARRGTALYMAVVSTAMIVCLLGLSGLMMVRLERTQLATGADRCIARTNANSAVELALRMIENNPNWRTTYVNGVETAPQSLGTGARGTLSWILEDSDGSLTDGDSNLRLKGIGRAGDSVQVSSIELKSVGTALNCLDVAICINGSVSLSNRTVTTTNQTMHSNGALSLGSNGVVNSDVDVAGAVTGSGTFAGTVTSPVALRDFPSASVFDYYLSNGTVIPYSSLPRGGPTRELVDVVLSPNSNPFGPTNPLGIYIIDCQGELFRAQFARVIGTLVLINPDPLSDIEDSLSMEPAVANYPVLLVQGSVDFKLSNSPLSEASRGVNFNPPGSPYGGSTDSDQTDTYPSLLKGIVYVSGRARVNADDAVMEGCFVVGGELEVTLRETLTVTYDSRFSSDPPPGFEIGNRIIAESGSWVWDEAP